MRKRDIAMHIHQQAGISETEAATLLECVLKLLKTTLQAGEPNTIQGFGKFAVRSKRARQGQKITARRVVTFHPSNLFTTEVNSVPARTRKEVAFAEREVVSQTSKLILIGLWKGHGQDSGH